MAQEVFLDFTDEGNPVISVKGIKGKSCKALTADLEAKLGETISTEATSEYNAREVNHATERASNKR